MDSTDNGSITMQKKIEAMLGAQLLTIAGLQDQLEQANARIAELEEQLKDATTKAPEKK